MGGLRKYLKHRDVTLTRGHVGRDLLEPPACTYRVFHALSFLLLLFAQKRLRNSMFNVCYQSNEDVGLGKLPPRLHFEGLTLGCIDQKHDRYARADGSRISFKKVCAPKKINGGKSVTCQRKT